MTEDMIDLAQRTPQGGEVTDPTAHASVLLALQAEVDELRAEVERLRAHRELCTENLLKGYETGKTEERAVVVRFLRGEAESLTGTTTATAFRVSKGLSDAADAIERRAHRREEK